MKEGTKLITNPGEAKQIVVRGLGDKDVISFGAIRFLTPKCSVAFDNEKHMFSPGQTFGSLVSGYAAVGSISTFGCSGLIVETSPKKNLLNFNTWKIGHFKLINSSGDVRQFRHHACERCPLRSKV